MSTTTNTVAKKMNFRFLHIAIVLFFMFIFGHICPTFSTVTPVGVNIIGVFLGLLYGWGTCGMFWPSLLAIIGIGCSGLMTIPQAISTGLGNYMILFMILMLVIVENIEHHGFTKNMALWLVSRKICKGRPWVLAFFIFLTAYLISAFANAFPALFLCWGFWYTIINEAGYEPYDKFTTSVICGTIFAVILGSILLPFHNQPLVFLAAFSGMTGGESINFAAFLGVSIPYTLICLLEYIFICKYIFKVDASRLASFDPLTLTNGENITFNKKQLASICGLLAVLLCLFLPALLPDGWAVTRLLNFLGMPGVAITVVVIMSWIKIDNEPLLEFAKRARTGVNWDVIMFITLILMVSSIITNEATGISTCIASFIGPLLMGKSMLMISIIIVGLAFIMTNFMNNMVTGFLFMSIVAAYIPGFAAAGISPWAVVTVLIFAANLAFWTPVASSTAGLLYGNSQWVKQKDILKVAIVTSIFWAVTLLTLGLGLAIFFFG